MADFEAVAAAYRAVFADSVIGVYLYGSAAAGRLRPTSDIDLLAVNLRPTTAAERRELIQLLIAMSKRGDRGRRARPMDLTIVIQDDVKPWRYPPQLDFQYGEWWRNEFERGNFAPWESPSPDLALLLAMALDTNDPVCGPPIDEVLDPVPPMDVRRAMLESIPALLADLDGDERNVVLTFARIWASLTTGAFRSKDAAADWALTRLPSGHRAVLMHARAIYLGDAVEEWGALRAQVRPHVEHVIGEIERAAAAADAGPLGD